MTKDYKLTQAETSLNPKKSTVDFILNYSKSVKPVQTKEGFVKLFLN